MMVLCHWTRSVIKCTDGKYRMKQSDSSVNENRAGLSPYIGQTVPAEAITKKPRYPYVIPREVEEALMTHPDIKEAAVIGIPDKLRGQAICAFIVPEDGGIKDKRMIRKYLLSRIAAYKVPKEFVFCEQLPRNNTGKVLKKILREQALENLINRK